MPIRSLAAPSAPKPFPAGYFDHERFAPYPATAQFQGPVSFLVGHFGAPRIAPSHRSAIRQESRHATGQSAWNARRSLVLTRSPARSSGDPLDGSRKWAAIYMRLRSLGRLLFSGHRTTSKKFSSVRLVTAATPGATIGQQRIYLRRYSKLFCIGDVHRRGTSSK